MREKDRQGEPSEPVGRGLEAELHFRSRLVEVRRGGEEEGQFLLEEPLPAPTVSEEAARALAERFAVLAGEGLAWTAPREPDEAKDLAEYYSLGQDCEGWDLRIRKDGVPCLVDDRPQAKIRARVSLTAFLLSLPVLFQSVLVLLTEEHTALGFVWGLLQCTGVLCLIVLVMHGIWWLERNFLPASAVEEWRPGLRGLSPERLAEVLSKRMEEALDALLPSPPEVSPPAYLRTLARLRALERGDEEGALSTGT